MQEFTQPVTLLHNFVVLCFHNLHDATAIHARCKENSIDAAIIDHKFVISFAHLAAALHRIVNNNVNMALLGQRQKLSTQPVARAVFVSLSRTHNLDRILQSLPAGPQTQSVIIVSQCLPNLQNGQTDSHNSLKEEKECQCTLELANRIRKIVFSTNPHAKEFRLFEIQEQLSQLSATAVEDEKEHAKVTIPNLSLHLQYDCLVDEAALMSYYCITESETENVMRGLLPTINEMQVNVRRRAL